MVMTIELRITGLAAFYRSKRKDFWHTIFICDALHPVNFRHAGKTEWTPLHINGKDRFISISANRARVPDSIYGDDFKKILNMTRPEMHGEENLSVKRSGTTNIISMMIPSAKLGTHTETPFDYYVINHATEKYYNVGPVTRTAKAIVELEDGDGLTMLIRDGEGASELAHFPFEDGETKVLEFYNDCDVVEAKVENDFIFYYDWLKDKNGTVCWAGRIAGDLAKAEKNRDVETQTIDEIIKILSPENGNCDVVVVEPPPPKQP